jgi:hypothetical protein
MKPGLVMLAIFALVSGCSHRLYWLEITPEKQVLEGYDEDQGLRDYIATLAKGPVVKGSTCSLVPLNTSMRDTTRRGAYADAIKKAGPPYDAMIDVVQTSIFYPPLPLYCISLEGTAVKNETQYATMNPSSSSAKPQGKSK